MTPQEILEFNKRCAEFLGWEITGPGFEAGYWDEKDFIQFDELKFHTDWNRIMEVVEAIEELPFTVVINDIACFISLYEDSVPPNYLKMVSNYPYGDISVFGGKNFMISKKEAVVQAISQFLIWYNENN